MPKAPILSREVYFAKRRDGTLVDLDYALVNTSLGAMVEPRTFYFVGSRVDTNLLDLDDISYTSRVLVDENTMFNAVGTWGPPQIPSDYNAGT